MSLPNGMKWEVDDEDGRLAIYGAKWDYFFEPMAANPCFSMAFKGTESPVRGVDSIEHAELIIRAIEEPSSLTEGQFVECKSGECSTCAAPVFHGPLDYQKEGE